LLKIPLVDQEPMRLKFFDEGCFLGAVECGKSESEVLLYRYHIGR
jgi:hypothetical protein